MLPGTSHKCLHKQEGVADYAEQCHCLDKSGIPLGTHMYLAGTLGGNVCLVKSLAQFG